MRPLFTRGFRLHHNGRVLDGAEFPSGRVLVLDDPEYGFATVATSLEELLKGYHGARVEWPPAVDRAAVLREVADGLIPVDVPANYTGAWALAYSNAVQHTVEKLRRMADEAQS